MEWFMVWDIISDRCTIDVLVRGPEDYLTTRTGGGCETALKPAPGNILRIQQIAYIRAAHRYSSASGCGAAIIGRVRIANDGSVRYPTWYCWRCGSVRLTGDQVKRSRCRWSEIGCIRVIAHREVIRVVPQ